MSKPYAEQFYNSGLWKQCRAEIIRRDHYQCQLCSSGRAEEVHHIIEITPDNINDPNITLNPDNLISLCHNCHTKITKGTISLNDEYIFDDDGQIIKIGANNETKQYESETKA